MHYAVGLESDESVALQTYPHICLWRRKCNDPWLIALIMIVDLTVQTVFSKNLHDMIEISYLVGTQSPMHFNFPRIIRKALARYSMFLSI